MLISRHDPDTSKARKESKLRILLVEDHSDTANVMSKIFEHEGFAVRAVGSYKESLKAAAEWLPDVLVSDIGLPGKDGLEVMKTMRQAYPSLKGIVVSGYAAPEDIARSKEAGFSDHLPKPISADQLIAAVKRLTEG